MWRHRSRGEHVGLIDSQPAIALKAQARGPSSFGVKGLAFYNGPVLVIRQSSCSSLQHLGQTRHDAIRHFDWARVDFFYRRLRKRDTMSRSRHRVQRQRGRSADEREALQTDTARAARSVRATLNFALRVHRIFSVRQIVPVDSHFCLFPGAKLMFSSLWPRHGPKQTRPGGRRGSEASNDGGEVYGAARLLIVRPMLTRLRSRRGRPSAAFRRHPSVSID